MNNILVFYSFGLVVFLNILAWWKPQMLYKLIRREKVADRKFLLPVFKEFILSDFYIWYARIVLGIGLAGVLYFLVSYFGL
jgi:hypothetical protein